MLFADCVEDAKKEVVKRRLKTELLAKGKQSQSQIEFETTLDKLAEMAKGKVKCEEFTAADRVNLLEVFVSSHKTLKAMNESMFQKGRSSEGKTLNTDGVNLETSSNFESKVDFKDLKLSVNSRNKQTFNTLDHRQLANLKQQSVAKSDINFDCKYFEMQPERAK